MKSKLLFACLLSTLLFSKEVSAQHQNVVKLNLFSLGLQDFSLQYERAFHKNMSGAFGISYMPGRGLPSSVTSTDVTGLLKELKFSGFAITPEFRFYPGKKVEKQAPRGFYFAPYLRYSSYTASMNLSVENPSTAVAYNLNMAVKYSGFGGGLMMGIQWLIKDRVSIDWWLLGAHGGSGSATATVSGSAMSTVLSDPTLRAQLQTTVNDLKSPKGTLSSEITNTDAKVSIAGVGYLGLRTGLTIGFAF